MSALPSRQRSRHPRTPRPKPHWSMSCPIERRRLPGGQEIATADLNLIEVATASILVPHYMPLTEFALFIGIPTLVIGFIWGRSLLAR